MIDHLFQSELKNSTSKEIETRVVIFDSDGDFCYIYKSDSDMLYPRSITYREYRLNMTKGIERRFRSLHLDLKVQLSSI